MTIAWKIFFSGYGGERESLKAEQPSDRNGQCISILSGFSCSFDNPLRCSKPLLDPWFSDICSQPKRIYGNYRDPWETNDPLINWSPKFTGSIDCWKALYANYCINPFQFYTILPIYFINFLIYFNNCYIYAVRLYKILSEFYFLH